MFYNFVLLPDCVVSLEYHKFNLSMACFNMDVDEVIVYFGEVSNQVA